MEDWRQAEEEEDPPLRRYTHAPLNVSLFVYSIALSSRPLETLLQANYRFPSLKAPYVLSPGKLYCFS